MKVDTFPYLVILGYANFDCTAIEDACSLVNGKRLDLSVTMLNTLAEAPNSGKKFFDAYGWSDMSVVEPLDILRVVLDNPDLDQMVKYQAYDLTIHRRLLHLMVPNIILPRMEEEDDESDDGAGDNEGTPIGDRSHVNDRTPVLRPHKLLIATSSRTTRASSAHEPCLGHFEASIADLKTKQQKLSKSVEDLATSVKIGFAYVKKILTDHTGRFGTVDKDVKSLQNQVSNSITATADVIQGTTDEFKATSTELQTFVKKSHEDITQVTKVCMNTDRLLRPHVMKWTY
ncbi:hypothetical protein CJ030_MR6G002440 [Morella rubra]|uniref:Uncharacterized protein n=1 Tax=Morella rubra TaxID=262757 RepID=A0A6A1VAJ9_9ROSI|nr:hypothetical protein CJ030_MR6G002440 [Morella rubra]